MFLPKIIHQDDNIAVVDKPAGMIVNRADTAKNQVTLQDWAEKEFGIKSQESRIEESSEFEKRAGIVHRLDKETSGLIIIAKDEESFRNLQAQFKNGEVKKVYIALCHGKVVPQEGEINVPVGRLPWNRMRFGVLAEGRQARTLYKVLKNVKFKDEELSLVEAYPQTGRTHQIRVHFQYLGHPIFGDDLYAGRKTKKADRKILPRHFLHAAKISFLHPKNGKRLELESSLPPELSEFISKTKLA